MALFTFNYGLNANLADRYSSDDSRVIETLSAIWPRRTRDQIKGLIEQWQLDLDTRDNYSGFHSQLAAQHALALARRVQLSTDEVGALWIAGHVYDLGKIALPPNLLTKDGPLNEAEMLVLHSHVSIGFDLLRGWAILRSSPRWLHDLVLETVLFHHERWDGDGYLKGKHGDETPLSARIMAIADAYTAMILNSPYRQAREPVAALQEIAERAGTQFDPYLVQQFIRAVRLGQQHSGIMLPASEESPQRASGFL